MAIAISHHLDSEVVSPWQGFKTGLWQRQINVRDFIQQNYEPYEGDDSFLAGATARTTNLWNRLNEVFVGLQTEAPLKRAIMPNGGFRMVVNALKTYGYEADPAVVETFTKYRKTHNEG